MPLAQFYEITFDYRKPYFIYGGLQDNGSWGGPSKNPYFPGPSNDDWFRLGGGDGFYVQVSPKDPALLYSESQNGSASRINQFTGESKGVRPRPLPNEKADSYRFDWNTPLLISPHNQNK